MNLDLNDPKVLALIKLGLEKADENRSSGINPPHKGGFIKRGEDIEFRLVFPVATFNKLLLYNVKRGRAATQPEKADDTFAVYAYFDSVYTDVENGMYNKREYRAMVRVTCGEMTVKDAKAAGISVFSELKANNPNIKGVSSALMYLRNPDEFADIAASLSEEPINSEGEEEEAEPAG